MLLAAAKQVLLYAVFTPVRLRVKTAGGVLYIGREQTTSSRDRQDKRKEKKVPIRTELLHHSAGQAKKGKRLCILVLL